MVFGAVGLLLFRLCKNKRAYRALAAFGVFALVVGSLLFLVSAGTYIPEFVQLRNAYVSGRSSVVEGIVENFHPAPILGRARESFSVGGVVFSYNALGTTPCFHNAPLHWGPVRDGLEVRIHYNEGCIQRVEIGR